MEKARWSTYWVLFLILSPLAAKGSQETFDHSLWDQVLKNSVVIHGPESRVKYSKLKNENQALDQYLQSIQNYTSDQFSALSESDRLAFLINAYNALSVKLVVDHYPVKSIQDIGGLFSNPWKKEFFKLFGKEHSLDDIEHQFIRKKFNEPRIHFVLVCASKGCPALRNEAYVGPRLELQFREATNTFLMDRSKNFFDAAQSKLHISSIFKWYGDDFVKRYGSVKTFLSLKMSRTPEEARKFLNPKVNISFIDYDWSLNDATK